MEMTALLYQFIVGGVFFTIGLVIPWRAGDLSWKKRSDRRLLLSMLVACFFYLIVQSVWHLYAAKGG
jgi:hypothetical protein